MAAGMRYSERTTVKKRKRKLISIASQSEMITVGTTPKAMNFNVVSAACQTSGSWNIWR